MFQHLIDGFGHMPTTNTRAMRLGNRFGVLIDHLLGWA